MSDLVDAMRYTMGFPARQEGKTATEIATKYIQPVYDAMAKDEGLTVAKLREAKRKLMDDQILKVMNPPIVFDPFKWRFASLPSSIDFATKETPMTTKKKTKPEKFNTIGVRFPESPGKEYTYKVRIGAKPYLGQELVADTPRGQAVVFVTRIDKTPQSLPESLFTPALKYIERKAVAL